MSAKKLIKKIEKVIESKRTPPQKVIKFKDIAYYFKDIDNQYKISETPTTDELRKVLNDLVNGDFVAMPF